MIKASFSLKRPDENKETSVVMRCQCSDGRLKYYTNISVLPSKWAKPSQAISAQLNKISKAINDCEERCNIGGVNVTISILKDALDLALGKTQKAAVVKGGLFQRWRNLIAGMKAGTILTPRSKNRYSKKTIRTLKFNIDVFERFSPTLRLDNINMIVYKQFIIWCQIKDYSTNYIGTLIKNMRTLCTISGHALPKEFRKVSEPAVDIYLTEEEIATIYKLMLLPREALVRDWFILDCYTGLRVSDLVVLSHENYEKDKITIANEKTGEKVVIPTHPFVRAIIKKYKGFPPAITDVEINRIIKKVCCRAKINGSILHTITKGGRKVSTYMKKYQMVTNHTARRSFITNLLKQGIPDAVVMKLTGLKSMSTLMKYNKMSAEEVAVIASKLAFFNS